MASLCSLLPATTGFSSFYGSRDLVSRQLSHSTCPRPRLSRETKPPHVQTLLAQAKYDSQTMPPSVDVVSHGTNLRERGFTVLADPVMDSALIDSARSQSQARLARLLQEVEALGCDPFEQQYRFKEIAQRQRNRWDLQLQEPGKGDQNSVWAQLCSAALKAATPVIQEAQGDAYCGIEPVMIGAVISRPGANVQRWHSDADPEHFTAANANPSHRLYNVFIPLVDVNEGSDGTEFWGAHLLEGSTRALGEPPCPF